MTAFEGWTYTPLVTVGEAFGDYYPPGIGDGIGPFLDATNKRVVILNNHELVHNVSYLYTLKNGVSLRGARITRYEFSLDGELLSAGLAYDTVYDRTGKIVTDPYQISEFVVNFPTSGFSRFCSGNFYPAGSLGFVDDLYIVGEETTKFDGSPHGGSFWALDPHSRTVWGLPDLGRGSWEAAGSIRISDEHMGLILSYDGNGVSPLYLYVGEKKPESSSILERNGLTGGNLYVWVADSGALNMTSFSGTGTKLAGSFVQVPTRDASKAGMNGYDKQGYLDEDTLILESIKVGALQFTRPEGLSTNPLNWNQVLVAITGVGSAFPNTNFGALIQIDMDLVSDLKKLRATVTIVFDGNDLQFRDFGIRNPDNLSWGSTARYIVEDASTMVGVPVGGCNASTDVTKCFDYAFGGRSQIEASIWQLAQSGYPRTLLEMSRIAVMNRNVTMPEGSSDLVPGLIGRWETSGINDISRLFDFPGIMLVGFAQAHTIRGGVIQTRELAEGGQLFFLHKMAEKINLTTSANLKTGNKNQLQINVKNMEKFTLSRVEVLINFEDAELSLPNGCFKRGGSLYGCEVRDFREGKSQQWKITIKKMSGGLVTLDFDATLSFGQETKSVFVGKQQLVV